MCDCDRRSGHYTRSRRPIVVTGATGGVGSLAVAILASSAMRLPPSPERPNITTGCAKLGAKKILTAHRSPRQDRPTAALRALGRRRRHCRRPAACHDPPLTRSIAAASPPAAWSPAPNSTTTRLSLHPPRHHARRHRFRQMPSARSDWKCGKNSPAPGASTSLDASPTKSRSTASPTACKKSSRKNRRPDDHRAEHAGAGSPEFRSRICILAEAKLH